MVYFFRHFFLFIYFRRCFDKWIYAFKVLWLYWYVVVRICDEFMQCVWCKWRKKACNGCILESISCYLRCRIFEINVKAPLIGMLIFHCGCIWFFFSKFGRAWHNSFTEQLNRSCWSFFYENNWIKRVFAPFPSNI